MLMREPQTPSRPSVHLEARENTFRGIEDCFLLEGRETHVINFGILSKASSVIMEYSVFWNRCWDTPSR